MSDDNPPIEQQRFARTQTPESPRPVHLPEPAKIPVLLNQMDQASNDLATYNIPADQTFAHYGDSLANPAYKSPMGNEHHDPLRDFIRQAENVVAKSSSDAHADANTAVDAPSANLAEPTTDIASLHTNAVPNPVDVNASNGTIAAQNASADLQALFTNPDGSSSLSNGGPATNGTVADHVAPNESSEREQNEMQVDDNSQEQVQAENQAAQARAEQDMSVDPQTQAYIQPEQQGSAGVDYQSLLDNITKSASTAPSAQNVATPVVEANVHDAQLNSLPSHPGLPPKPPPLDAQHPPPLSIISAPVHQLPTPDAGAYAGLPSAANHAATNPNAGSTNPASAGVTSEQLAAIQTYYNQQSTLPKLVTTGIAADSDPSDRPWSPKTQSIYDTFLEDERKYVVEGIWDRFPIGSRLFVGNLPSEKVTKRDLFHRFHRHGRLAQISIKQAYGFIQFHLAEDCKKALDAEQGVEIRGRKVHLEISKPQKGSKASQPQKNQSPVSRERRRSRSPVRRSYSDFRDEPSRRREDFRKRRSPSPPRYRRNSRDDRRSPVYGNSFSPHSAIDDEASLPYPRRDPRYVPDVQIIVLDGNSNQAFVNWVEDNFKRKGLNAASTWLNQRTPLPAVVKRQIVEGVQAVVKLSVQHQNKHRIPLQVFDRSAGGSNVQFNEYVDLDPSVAADVIIAARQRERGAANTRNLYTSPFPQNNFVPSPSTPWQPPPPMQFPSPQMPQQFQYPQQQQYRPPQIPPPFPSPNSAATNPGNLQELLANLKGGPNLVTTPQSAPPGGQPMQFGQPGQQAYGMPPSNYGQQQFQQYQQSQQQQGSQQDVQFLLNQIARGR